MPLTLSPGYQWLIYTPAVCNLSADKSSLGLMSLMGPCKMQAKGI